MEEFEDTFKRQRYLSTGKGFSNSWLIMGYKVHMNLNRSLFKFRIKLVGYRRRVIKLV